MDVPIIKQAPQLDPIANADRKARGEACLKEVSEALQKYRCKQNVIVRLDMMNGISGEVVIIPD